MLLFVLRASPSFLDKTLGYVVNIFAFLLALIIVAGLLYFGAALYARAGESWRRSRAWMAVHPFTTVALGLFLIAFACATAAVLDAVVTHARAAQ